ncbi:hypothetical protein C7974DRAFT_475193 [Boeremia exigua]|uniref:uncharacterized protein n=1 Tax=Boeremia exigua TaxID=749465 RepID=UPI001E8D42D3|nr:uncharacterized protein C7974DRAFT_475193 [Boeremia exigua]KAH6616808.1 hypothetical protein C7974DRAFT_475193 [Boeremia exigua]
MVAASWLFFPAASILLSIEGVLANPGLGLSVSPSYRTSNPCPERCKITGPNASNWSVYPDFKKIQKCQETMFYDFSLTDDVDDPESTHKINACSSFGPDFSKLANSTAETTAATAVDCDFELGWWEEGFGLKTSSIRSVIRQIRDYADSGYGATDRPFILFGRSGQASVGVYIGQSLSNEGLSATALKKLEDGLTSLNVSSPSLAMQLCSPESDSGHIFGVMVTSNSSFGPIQEAIKKWNNATCLEFPDSVQLTGQATFITPLLSSNGTSNSTLSNGTLSQEKRHLKHMQHHHIRPRAECKTVQVESGDSCASLATKCGIPSAAFTKVNPASDFCSTLMPKQHVCCSSGTMPDFSPKKNADGSCHAYQVVTDDNCDNLASEYSLTKDKIESFNKKTWGWNGCQLLFVDTIMCLSEGTPPFPAPIANAQCGPQKPGSVAPTDGSNITTMNPCALNACCNIWGQCGITKDFCVDTSTGPPGTAKKGTFGCISNCGTDIIKGSGSGSIKIAYFEGYNMQRDCLLQDASQIDTSGYTHLHFGFGTLTSDFQVETGDILSTYQFQEFKKVTGAKKVISFGGWDFSTNPATYTIFRQGVTSANRLKMAQSLAKFVNDNDLDGVDIDWEYPGAPDIPGIPAASKDDGANYLAFLVVLKNLLGRSKTVSIAAPSSYWYLKQFPIKDIAKVVDYIVYMTYDLHGQWDTDNAWSQEGCDMGNCLRSQVNLTETKQSLAMVTKAGVPGEKIIVGVTSYGRSYNMAASGCWGPNCLYTGSRAASDATPGKCTATGGYIADAEIADIIADRKRSGRVVTSFVDASSNSDILVYDDSQWVSYMSASTKKTRATLYTAWGMGGTSDWASDLQTYNDVPEPAASWAEFKQRVKAGEDPKTDHSRTGNWTDLDCTSKFIASYLDYTPSQRWKGLDTDAAWDDVLRIWKDTDSDRIGVSFMQSVSSTLHMGAQPDCEKITSATCAVAMECPDGANGKESGPAAELIWNSLATIHQMYQDYYNTLFNVASVVSMSLKDLENKFAPLPEPQDNTWLLVMIDLLTVGTLTAAGPFFNTFLKKLPYFLEKASSSTLDNAKDTAMNLIGQSTTLAKDLLSTDDPKWTAEKQDAFSNYLGQVIDGWATVAELTVQDLFDGSQGSIDLVWGAMSGGKLIEGKFETEPEKKNITTELRQNIGKSFFGYAIPNLWRVSKTYAFVVDSGYDCSEDKPLDKYLDDETMEATGACVDNKRYYLVYPKGDSTTCTCTVYDHGPCQTTCVNTKFSAPPGIDTLDGALWSGISKEDLIKGSVNTYIQNGGNNGGATADPRDKGTMEALMDVDITTPGFIRLPVCSPERAFQSWDTSSAGSSSNYPCDIPPGIGDCSDSSFENETSDASPDVDDCLKIIKNIEGDGSTEWTTQVVGHNQREIAKAGSCSFGVEATKTDGNVNFRVGGQDVIDIINDAIKQFGGGGKIGAKGDMSCNGNVKQQNILYMIFSQQVIEPLMS